MFPVENVLKVIVGHEWPFMISPQYVNPSQVPFLYIYDTQTGSSLCLQISSHSADYKMFSFQLSMTINDIL